VVVESPRGSAVKFKFDPTHQVMTLSRPLTLGMSYPYDWGFVPSTHAPDGDPLDAFVMWEGVSYPGVVLTCRAVGVLKVEQNSRTSERRERNDRIAVLPTKAPRFDAVRTVFDFTERARRELQEFFQAAVALESRDLRILGWGGPADAVALIRRSAANS
jgi:inorganic pyrophosphatase